MPPLPRLRVLGPLLEQLRFTPRAAIARDVERAEAFAADIDPARNYPEDFVVFRLTGYRPETDDPAILPGDAVLGDLSALVEHLTDHHALPPPDGALTVPDLMERWGSSRKTIDRARRRGLVARRARDPGGRTSLVFIPASVEAYERRVGAAADRARSFARLGPELEQRLIARARRFARLGCSRNQAAARLAKRHGRAPETIRQLLARHDARAGVRAEEPIFSPRHPPTDRERELARRAAARGLPPSAVAKRLGTTARAVRRAATDHQASLLRSAIAIALPDRAPTTDVADTNLPPTARVGLGLDAPATVAALLEQARATPPPDPVTERARAEAFAVLLNRAAATLEAEPARTVSTAALDRAETALRWAHRLHTELLRAQLGTVLRALAQRTDPDTLPSADLAGALTAALEAAALAAARFRPRKGGRLAAPVTVAVDRALARLPALAASRGASRGATNARDKSSNSAHPTPRSDANTNTRSIARPLPNPNTPIAPLEAFAPGWVVLVECDPRVRLVARTGQSLSPDRCALLRARFGWAGLDASGAAVGGEPPRTLASIAQERGTDPMHAARAVRAAIAHALRAARAAGLTVPHAPGRTILR